MKPLPPDQYQNNSGRAFCTTSALHRRNRSPACRQGSSRCALNLGFGPSGWPQLQPSTDSQPPPGKLLCDLGQFAYAIKEVIHP